MRLKLAFLFLAGALVTTAQALTGLPQYGVVLDGDPWSPVVVNNSQKSLLGLVVKITGENGEEYAVLKPLFPNGKPIPPGGRMEILVNGTSRMGIAITDPDTRKPLDPKKVVKHAILDAVIFEDGSYVGPDALDSFQAMQNRMADHRHMTSRESQKQLEFAADKEALRAHYQSLPVLHKENQ